jgi:nucleoporin NUP82
MSGTPKKLLRKSIAYLGDDEGEDIAVSFTFGATHAEERSGWAPFTLYCLMQNGDLYSVCPYLPKTAKIPADYLSTLSAYTSARLDLLSKEEGVSFGDRQMRESRYAQQLKLLNSLLIQGSNLEGNDREGEDGFIRMQYPTYLRHLQACKQGPFDMVPVPQELNNQQESLACNLAIVDLGQSEGTLDDAESCSTISVFVIAHCDGRVDVCLESERTEPIWTSVNHQGVSTMYLLLRLY